MKLKTSKLDSSQLLKFKMKRIYHLTLPNMHNYTKLRPLQLVCKFNYYIFILILKLYSTNTCIRSDITVTKHRCCSFRI